MFVKFAKNRIKKWASDPKNLVQAVKFLLPILLSILGKRLPNSTADMLRDIGDNL